jgi:hypothetical protein
MFKDFVADIAPAVLLSLVLSIAGVLAAMELAKSFHARSVRSKRVKRALLWLDPLGGALLFSMKGVPGGWLRRTGDPRVVRRGKGVPGALPIPGSYPTVFQFKVPRKNPRRRDGAK